MTDASFIIAAHCVPAGEPPTPTSLGSRDWRAAELACAGAAVYTSPPEFPPEFRSPHRSDLATATDVSAIGADLVPAGGPDDGAPGSGQAQTAVLSELLLVLLFSWVPW
ncbi:Uncharacterised protein [Amycolatopsis camponoti]|uniref:Uncharacterized protein n=1 Tax=Amycolatopsis camponoti TaxID=2606593 RepID=A0A6I8M3T8_9PSEU|nr:hypothetical protein [Amycolatopsis camponoti]VVJ22659.1 Uncharacterised protein [Amycolatopsis camponoti]